MMLILCNTFFDAVILKNFYIHLKVIYTGRVFTDIGCRQGIPIRSNPLRLKHLQVTHFLSTPFCLPSLCLGSHGHVTRSQTKNSGCLMQCRTNLSLLLLILSESFGWFQYQISLLILSLHETPSTIRSSSGVR